MKLATFRGEADARCAPCDQSDPLDVADLPGGVEIPDYAGSGSTKVRGQVAE